MSLHVSEKYSLKSDVLKQQLDAIRNESRKYQDNVHSYDMKMQTMTNQLRSTEQNLTRMHDQIKGLESAKIELTELLKDALSPIEEMEKRLEILLSDRIKIEDELIAARKKLENIDASMRQHEKDRHLAEQKVQDSRSSLEQSRMVWQEFNIRARTLKEQLDQTNYKLQELLEALDENATESEWQELVEKFERKIQRLGPINLAAIDEFAEQTERKEYLDLQYADVTSALETLENAIKKIDKESRTRFKETFDK
ncbi:MAG: chromosome segregation protein SMC, partial [Gammaproteobacteria bacterium]|nr:chromosome segregation protein SMC [Gammaproteobacteria bacterium]